MENIKLEDLPARPEADQAAFYQDCLNCAKKAQAAVGTLTYDIRVAGGLMRIKFAGSALADCMLPAIAHLVVENAETPDMVLNVMDQASTGVAAPKMPVARTCLTDRGDIWSFNSTRFRSAFHWLESSINVMDMDTHEAVFWVASRESLPYWTKASPFRTIFHWWMTERGAQLIHAAGIGYQDSAVLVTGKGGVGKSTTALACLNHGMLYAADDYLIVTFDDVPRVHSLYSTAKLEIEQAERFPELRSLIVEEPKDGEKSVISLYPSRKHLISSGMPIKAVLTPSFGGKSETEFEPIHPHDLRSAAAFTTLSQLPHSGPEAIDFINRLIEDRPTFRMKLGHDISSVPIAIENLLKRSIKTLEQLSHIEIKEFGANDSPLISVIVPVYNGASFLSDAITSILDQNYPNLEIIVVDDGSEDDITTAVKALPVEVRLFRQENAGPASARNRGIRDASGEYIAFLDVDDQWPADRLRQMVDRLMANPNTQIVQGHSQLLRRENATSEFEAIGNPAESFKYYIGSALYRKTAFEQTGLFDAEMIFGEDADWFMRAEEINLPIEPMGQITLFVRRHESNMTRGKSLRELNMLRLFKNQRDRQKMPGQTFAIAPDTSVET